MSAINNPQPIGLSSGGGLESLIRGLGQSQPPPPPVPSPGSLQNALSQPPGLQNRGPFGAGASDFGPFQEPDLSAPITSGTRVINAFQPTFRNQTTSPNRFSQGQKLPGGK